jgi:hypothetical protein
MLNTRIVAVAVVAYFLAPLWRKCEAPTGGLDDIKSWALKGPTTTLPAKINGVFVFRGLNPALLVDMSYARSYQPEQRSFVLDMGRAFIMDTDARATDFTREFKSTNPSPDLRGKELSAIFRTMHASLKFTFNEDFTAAEIEPRMISDYFPLNFLVTRLIKEQLVANKDHWKRINFVPPSNATAAEAHYFLHPVVMRTKDGKLKVNRKGLRMAKRKLAMGSGEFAQCH